MADLAIEINLIPQPPEPPRARRVTALGFVHYQSHPVPNLRRERRETIDVLGVLIVDEQTHAGFPPAPTRSPKV